MQDNRLKLNKHIKIVVVGDVMLDKYWKGNVTRVSPEAPVPILNAQHVEFRAGGASNVTLNLASLGAYVSLFGIIGKDKAGEKLCDLLNHNQINNNLIVKKNFQTTVKVRFIDSNHQLLRVDHEEKNTNVKFNINNLLRRSITDSKLIIFSDYGKGVLNEIPTLIKLSKSLKKISVVDPKGGDFVKYNGATIITPNFLEFEKIVGPCKTTRAIELKGYELIKKHNFKYLVVTRGSKGLTVITSNNHNFHLNAEAKEVFDVTGAGDTLLATLSFFLAYDLNFVSSCNLANYAAGIVVGKTGTSTVNLLDLKDKISKYPEMSMQKNDLYSIKNLCKYYKSLNKKIVFTNGCFDILHVGHIHVLNEAKKLGDILIVAINSDSSVKLLKGECRPINNLESRINMLENIKSVDYVIPFEEENPLNIIKQISPDIIVKGGDYKKKDIIGGDYIKKRGGKVINISLLKGISSTKIINKIKGL